MSPKNYLGIDAGASKTGWAVMTGEGKILEEGQYPTPTEKDQFVRKLENLVLAHPTQAVGIGLAGTISANHEDIVVSPNLPDLSHTQLVNLLKEENEHSTLDNDARCALIGEVWQGAAQKMSNVVLLTIGTGVGGAVMQKGVIHPHPEDINKEIGRIVVDPQDGFVSLSGRGTIEAFLGGRNLEQRLGIDMRQMAIKVREGSQEAREVWKQISYYFILCMRAIKTLFDCETILIGGVGSKDLKYYLQEEPPCPVIPARLGEKAGVYGAARIAIDLVKEKAELD